MPAAPIWIDWLHTKGMGGTIHGTRKWPKVTDMDYKRPQHHQRICHHHHDCGSEHGGRTPFQTSDCQFGPILELARQAVLPERSKLENINSNKPKSASHPLYSLHTAVANMDCISSPQVLIGWPQKWEKTLHWNHVRQNVTYYSIILYVWDKNFIMAPLPQLGQIGQRMLAS